MDVVAYYRTTNKKNDYGKGIACQKKAVREFCGENGHTIVKEVSETCPGAYLGPCLKELAEQGSSIGAGAVVAMNLDCFTRSVSELMGFYQTLAEKGLGIISTMDNTRMEFHIPGRERSR